MENGGKTVRAELWWSSVFSINRKSSYKSLLDVFPMQLISMLIQVHCIQVLGYLLTVTLTRLAKFGNKIRGVTHAIRHMVELHVKHQPQDNDDACRKSYFFTIFSLAYKCGRRGFVLLSSEWQRKKPKAASRR